MLNQETYTETTSLSLTEKIKDYASFVKFRLNALVVLSALSGYLFAPPQFHDGFTLGMLCLGGFLITGASNGLNQVWEKDIDKPMNRPIPRGSMSVAEGIILSFLMGMAGFYLLYVFVNPKSAWLSLIALVLYVLIYTPMKKVSPWSVFVGAFPGAMPPLLGWVAATNEFGFIPGMLFFIQFIWQFPHFWAVAWVGKDDYDRAGYKLLPSKGGRNKFTSLTILLYTLILIPVSFAPWLILNRDFWSSTPIEVGYLSLIVVALANLGFYMYASKLHQTNELKDAKRLMFASFIYLPIVQFIYVIDKVSF